MLLMKRSEKVLELLILLLLISSVLLNFNSSRLFTSHLFVMFIINKFSFVKL